MDKWLKDIDSKERIVVERLITRIGAEKGATAKVCGSISFKIFTEQLQTDEETIGRLFDEYLAIPEHRQYVDEVKVENEETRKRLGEIYSVHPDL